MCAIVSEKEKKRENLKETGITGSSEDDELLSAFSQTYTSNFYSYSNTYMHNIMTKLKS